MDDNRFDRLVQELAREASRRRLLRRLSALPLAGGLAVIFAGGEASEARKHHHKKHKHKKHHKKKHHPVCSACSAGCCDGGTCQPGDSTDACGANGAACAVCGGATPLCQDGACVCGDVCATGCQFSSVQAAIDAAGAGAAIRVCAGTFTEHLTISKDVTILGAGQGDDPAADTILDGGGGGNVVYVSSGGVALQNLRITHGFNSAVGGGILNDGIVALTDCTVSGNTADPGGGGGIVNRGRVTLDRTTVSGNTGLIFGGGLFNGSGATSTCVDCDFSDNTPHDCQEVDTGSCDGCGA